MCRVEHLLSVQNVAGESPIWVAAEESLYWVDCEGAKAFRVGLGNAAWETVEADMPVTALCPRAKGG